MQSFLSVYSAMTEANWSDHRMCEERSARQLALGKHDKTPHREGGNRRHAHFAVPDREELRKVLELIESDIYRREELFTEARPVVFVPSITISQVPSNSPTVNDRQRH